MSTQLFMDDNKSIGSSCCWWTGCTGWLLRPQWFRISEDILKGLQCRDSSAHGQQSLVLRLYVIFWVSFLSLSFPTCTQTPGHLATPRPCSWHTHSPKWSLAAVNQSDPVPSLLRLHALCQLPVLLFLSTLPPPPPRCLVWLFVFWFVSSV